MKTHLLDFKIDSIASILLSLKKQIWKRFKVHIEHIVDPILL